MSERMCDNKTCAEFGKPTRLMGGCECGSPLIPYMTADESARETAWNLLSPEAKRLVTYGILGRAMRGKP